MSRYKCFVNRVACFSIALQDILYDKYRKSIWLTRYIQSRVAAPDVEMAHPQAIGDECRLESQQLALGT